MPDVQSISSPRATRPLPGAHYSPAVKVSDVTSWIFVTGQTGMDPETRDLSEKFEDQARSAFEKVDALVEAAGGTRKDIVQLRIYYKDVAYVSAVVELRNELFSSEPYPAITGVVCDLTSPEMLIEVDAVAAI